MSGDNARASRAESSEPERIGVEALFRAHAQFVANFLHRLGAPRDEIDDLVQEVFMVAHQKGGYVRGPAQPRSWLGAISVHVAQTSRRARRRMAAPSSPMLDRMVTGIAAGVDSQLERAQKALDNLPIEQRAAFILFEIEGESCESIAAVWEVPVGTVYSRLHHARRKFMEVFELDLGAGEASASSTTGAR